MIAVLQRVKKANVTVASNALGEIARGLLIFLGVMADDEDNDVDCLVKKISGLRIFNDENSKMNLAINDVQGAALVVSQFTLCADTSKGRRPSFVNAAPPPRGQHLYERFILKLHNEGIPVQSGRFGAMMNVSLENDGPVTIILDSKD